MNVEEPPVTGPDGHIIYYLTSRVPLHDKAGKVSGVVGISIDITEQKRLEQLAIKEQNLSMKLEEIINHIPAPIYWMDKNCVYQGCNKNAAKFTRLESTQGVKGKTYTELTEKSGWNQDQAAKFLRDDLWVLKHDKPKLNMEEGVMVRPDGRLI